MGAFYNTFTHTLDYTFSEYLIYTKSGKIEAEIEIFTRRLIVFLTIPLKHKSLLCTIFSFVVSFHAQQLDIYYVTEISRARFFQYYFFFVNSFSCYTFWRLFWHEKLFNCFLFVCTLHSYVYIMAVKEDGWWDRPKMYDFTHDASISVICHW